MCCPHFGLEAVGQDWHQVVEIGCIVSFTQSMHVVQKSWYQKEQKIQKMKNTEWQGTRSPKVIFGVDVQCTVYHRREERRKLPTLLTPHVSGGAFAVKVGEEILKLLLLLFLKTFKNVI